MYRYILLLGGNLGNVSECFASAVEQLLNIGTLVCKSDLYQSKAWGFEAETDFLNQVVEVQSSIEPMQFLKHTQSIEQQLGRTHKSVEGQYESRLIDIDILFCNHDIINTEKLIVPHPLLHKRRFTLAPLMECWSQFQHPLMNKTIAQLYDECPDDSIVNRKTATLLQSI